MNTDEAFEIFLYGIRKYKGTLLPNNAFGYHKAWSEEGYYMRLTYFPKGFYPVNEFFPERKEWCKEHWEIEFSKPYGPFSHTERITSKKQLKRVLKSCLEQIEWPKWTDK